MLSWSRRRVLECEDASCDDFTIIVPLYGDPRYFDERHRIERERVGGDDRASLQHLPALEILCHVERPRFSFSGIG